MIYPQVVTVVIYKVTECLLHSRESSQASMPRGKRDANKCLLNSTLQSGGFSLKRTFKIHHMTKKHMTIIISGIQSHLVGVYSYLASFIIHPVFVPPILPRVAGNLFQSISGLRTQGGKANLSYNNALTIKR